LIVLANDVKRFPGLGGEDLTMQEDDIEINAPGFCDPGSVDRSNGTRMCTKDDILRAIPLRPLAFEPWTRPLYSNTGFNLLGWATTEAANPNSTDSTVSQEGEEEKGTPWNDLIQQDIFDPLNMKDSSFWLRPDIRNNVVVPAKGVPNIIDWDFTNTFNPYLKFSDKT